MLKPVLAAALLLTLTVPALAERLAAEADCAATDDPLVYECVIEVAEGGAPLGGAAFTVKPDMPSMPMAHNIAPVAAEAGDAPGAYRVPLRLDMHGRWTLRLDFTAPRRDVIVIDHEFAPAEDAAGHAGHGN
jgi:hypothetical protein